MRFDGIHICAGCIQCNLMGFIFGQDVFNAIRWDSYLGRMHSV